jgi:putative transposase
VGLLGNAEVCTARGFVTFYVLFFLDLASRTVKIAGVTRNPGDAWMTQIARDLTDPEEEFLRRTRYVILDRDTKYSDAFRGFLVRDGIQVIRLPPRAPNLNAYAERFVRSIKEECLSRMIFFGEASLRHALAQYMAHYHLERNHQGVGNQLLQNSGTGACVDAALKRRQRLGGMLSFYHRAPA